MVPPFLFRITVDAIGPRIESLSGQDEQLQEIIYSISCEHIQQLKAASKRPKFAMKEFLVRYSRVCQQDPHTISWHPNEAVVELRLEIDQESSGQLHKCVCNWKGYLITLHKMWLMHSVLWVTMTVIIFRLSFTVGQWKTFHCVFSTDTDYLLIELQGLFLIVVSFFNNASSTVRSS